MKNHAVSAGPRFALALASLCCFAISTGCSAESGRTSADASSPQETVAGLWMGTYVPFGQYTPQERYLRMYEDGTFFHDLPLEGLEGFDKEKSRQDEHQKDYWGHYTFSGTTGTWNYDRSTGEPTEMRLNAAGDLEIGSDTYYRLAAVDGLVLDGAWTSYADPTDPDLGNGGIQPILRFSPDARFVDDGLFASGFGTFLGEEEQARAPGRGTYELRNFTLLLRYDDGRVRKAGFSLLFKAPQAPAPDAVFIYRTRLNRMP